MEEIKRPIGLAKDLFEIPKEFFEEENIEKLMELVINSRSEIEFKIESFFKDN